MNEIILIGEVTSKVIKANNGKISMVYLKVNDETYNKTEYIPICFRSMNYDYLISLKGKEIGISGHVESKPYNRIFVDVIKVL